MTPTRTDPARVRLAAERVEALAPMPESAIDRGRRFWTLVVVCEDFDVSYHDVVAELVRRAAAARRRHAKGAA